MTRIRMTMYNVKSEQPQEIQLK